MMSEAEVRLLRESYKKVVAGQSGMSTYMIYLKSKIETLDEVLNE
jgi:hypothetical protein